MPRRVEVTANAPRGTALLRAGTSWFRRDPAVSPPNVFVGLALAAIIAVVPFAVGACSLFPGDAGFDAVIRNDTTTTYLVDFNFMDHFARVFRVPGHSRMGLYGASGSTPDARARAVIFTTDCQKVATVELTNDLNTIYVDPQGKVTVRPFRDVPFSGTTDISPEGSFEPGCSG